MVPEKLPGLQVKRRECPSETEVGLRIGIVETFPEYVTILVSPGPVPQSPWEIRRPRWIGRFLSTNKRVQHVALQGHPFPGRSISKSFWNDNLFPELSGSSVKQFA